MAKNNKISMPSSTAGITRYFEGFKSNFEIKPGYVILLCVLVIIILTFLHMYGDAWLGI
jgi:preprotein translocase subunit Sec61beta